MSYKILRGTTVGSSTYFVRVNHEFLIKRQINYKNSRFIDIGGRSVRFARRRPAFARTFYGQIRPR